MHGQYNSTRVYNKFGMFGEVTLFKHLVEKVWQMNRSPKGLLIVTTNLEDFSLVNCR